MIQRRLAMFTALFVFSIAAVVLTANTVLRPLATTRKAYADGSVSYICGTQVNGSVIVKCTLITPPPLSPSSPRSTTIITSATQFPLNVSVRIDLQGITFTTPVSFESLRAEVGAGANPLQMINTGLTGTFQAPNSVIITGTNMPIIAPSTIITFYLTNAGRTFSTAFTFNVVKHIDRFLPVITRDYCAGSVNIDCGEPNDTFATAFSGISINQTFTATVNRNTDLRDYYKIALDAQPYTVAVNKLDGSGDLDLYIYDDASKTLKCQSNFNGVSNETVHVNSPSPSCQLPPGVYDVLVYDFADPNNATTAYTLKISQP